MRATLPLFEKFPGLAGQLAHTSLAELPTPLETNAKASKAWNLNSLRIKRDDLSSPLYGGNKIRKLEFALADARDNGCDAVLTFGAVGSNHVLATSIFAQGLGMACHAVLTPQAPSPKVTNTLRYHAYLKTKLYPAEDMNSVRQQTDKILDRHPGGRNKIYQLPWGGSSWRGTAGFVNAALELAQQLGDEVPDLIYVATGTMGTSIGLAMGLRLLRWPTKLVAVRVVPQPVMTPEYFERLYRDTNTKLHDRDASFPLLDDPGANVVARDEFFGEGYAVPTDGTLQAVQLAEDILDLGLETTYTGKALAALIHDERAARLEGKNVLFWNTYNSRDYPDAVADCSMDSIPASLNDYFPETE